MSEEQILRDNGLVEEVKETSGVELATDDIVAIAGQAEKRIEAINKIKKVALAVTNWHDWTNQGGKPYLQVSGAEKVAGVFGISWQIYPPELINEDDGHYSYRFSGLFSMGGRSIEQEGSRGTKDPFFSKTKKGNKPISEIDRNDVRKSALTNLVGNGVTRILGIRNLTWDDLKEANIDTSKITTINYKNNTEEMSEEAKELREKIKDMINEMIDNDVTKFQKALVKVTTFTGKDGKEVPGKKQLSQITEKAMPVVYKKVKDGYEAWKKGK